VNNPARNRTILNIYVLNTNAPKFIKLTLLSVKEQMGPDTLTVKDINTSLSSIDRASRQKINKDILEQSNTMEERT
jgi:hypothetical protein